MFNPAQPLNRRMRPPHLWNSSVFVRETRRDSVTIHLVFVLFNKNRKNVLLYLSNRHVVCVACAVEQIAGNHFHIIKVKFLFLSFYRSVVRTTQSPKLDNSKCSGLDQRPGGVHQIRCEHPESSLLHHGWPWSLPNDPWPNDRGVWPTAWTTPLPESARAQVQIW